MLKSTSLLLILGCAIIVALTWLTGSHSVRFAPRSPDTVVVLGDSIGEGYGVASGEAWPDFLRERLQLEIVNLSVSGFTTADAVRRLPEALEYDPALVIVEVGGNDLIKRVDIGQTEESVRKIIETLYTREIAVLLVGIEGPLGIGEVDELYKDLSREYETAYTSNILRGILGDKDLMIDQIHPNAEGHKIIADRIENAVRKQIPGLIGQ